MSLRRLLLIWALLLAGIVCLAQQPTRAYWQSRDSNYNIAISGAAPSGWCALIPQSGLINCWPFDTTNTTTSVATDTIGGKNAALTNVTLAGSGPSTNLNNAGVFNGTTSTALTTALASAPGGATWSFVQWINPTTINGKRTAANDNPVGGTNNGFQLLGVAGNAWGCSAGNGITSTTASVGGVVSTGVWGMVTCTFDGTTLRSYFGSTATGTALLAGLVTGGSASLGFGYNPSYNGDFCPCNIAGIAIYNITLSAGQVTTINGL